MVVNDRVKALLGIRLILVFIAATFFAGLQIAAQQKTASDRLSEINTISETEDKEPSLIAPNSSQVDVLGPTGSGTFGQRAWPLPNGNIVVIDQGYDIPGAADAGAAHLYDGTTGTLINTMAGTVANQQIGGIFTLLPNGDYVLANPGWDNGAALDAGAITLCRATTGCPTTITAANSLVGSSSGDISGAGVIVLTNGNYVISLSSWDDGVGAPNSGSATWCNGTTGCTGVISPANSLIGSANSSNFVVHSLPNGNYTVASSTWSGLVTNGGAVTFCSGTGGCTGPMSTANSLYGTTAEDRVGTLHQSLGNGNYIVHSNLWNGAAVDVGAVTFCNGTSGCSGPVSAANSLVGSSLSDNVGQSLSTILANGNYLVQALLWDGGAADIGAVRLCSGTSGCTGTMSAANALIGTTTGDQVGSGGIFELTNGNYVVTSPRWNGAAADVGAVTWCSGTTGCIGQVTAANSLTGSTANDNVGTRFGLTTLFNGDYVVATPLWDGAVSDAGAVTYCNGFTGTTGVVSPTNSLVGSTVSDQVGGGRVRALAGVKYVVRSPLWDGAATNVGAVTFCGAPGGCVGVVSTANSLVGSTLNDQVGGGTGSQFVTLTNGNYVVTSPLWNGTAADVGAVTWCSGTTGCTGTVSAANSIVGSAVNDKVGDERPNSSLLNGEAPLTALPNGDYYFGSGGWDNGGNTNAGAVTYGNGNGGTVGTINSQNSVLGTAFGGGQGIAAGWSTFLQKLIVGRPGSNRYTVYTPDASGVDVSGRILTSGGRGVRGAVVRLNDGPTVVQTVTTDAFGKYRFQSVATGRTYTITVNQRRFSFSPRSVNVNTALIDIDITAS